MERPKISAVAPTNSINSINSIKWPFWTVLSERHSEWNRATPGMEPVDIRDGTAENLGCGPTNSINSINSIKWAKDPSIPSILSIRLSLGRVFQFHVLCQLQALFREIRKNLVFRRPADLTAWRC